jgi:hypothetical protein
MATILLTSTINFHSYIECMHQRNIQERIDTYVYSVRQWLYNTTFNIVLVENSGYHFKELDNEKECFSKRFEVIVFDEKQLDEARYVLYAASKGRHELFAINYAVKYSELVKLSTFIIKITARFFIPGLESYLQNYDLNNYDCLVQHDRTRCEMVGCHKNMFHYIFHPHADEDHIESVYLRRTSTCNNILVCTSFNITPTPRGGVDEIFTTI